MTVYSITCADADTHTKAPPPTNQVLETALNLNADIYAARPVITVLHYHIKNYCLTREKKGIQAVTGAKKQCLTGRVNLYVN